MKAYYFLFAACLWVIISFFIFLQEPALGDEFTVKPSLALKEEYNDNIFFDDHNKKDDFILTVSPELKVSNRTERSALMVSGRLDGIAYSDNTDLNAVDHDYNGRLGYDVTENTGFTATAGYKKDSRPDRDINVGGTGESTGLVLSSDTRIRRSASVSGTHMLNEMTGVNVGCDFSEDDFEDIRDNDIKSYRFNAGMTRRLGFFKKPTVARLNTGYATYDYDDSELNTQSVLISGLPAAGLHFFQNTGIDSYFLTIGAMREISEIFSILVDLGGRYTHSEFENKTVYDPWILPLSNVSEKNTHNSEGFVANATLSYKGILTDCDVSLSHDLMESSGRSGPTERTSIRFNIRKQLTYKLRANLQAGYYYNKSDAGEFGSGGVDEQTLSISPGITFAITKDVLIDASYTYTKIKDKEDHTDRKRNLFFVRVKGNFSLFE